MNKILKDGIVYKVYGAYYFVKIEDKLYQCALRGKLKHFYGVEKNLVAVGDRVKVSDFDANSEVCEGYIDEVYERKNKLTRAQIVFGKIKEQILASNIDQICIVASLKNPILKTGFIDRILVAASFEDIPCNILFNKYDLIKKDKDGEYFKLIRKTYKNLGYEVFFSSMKEKKGIDDVRNLISGKKTMLIGYSGVGKSTLINTLLGYERQKTLEISNYSGKGKHATTNPEMIELDTGDLIIDTPGLKEYSIKHFAKEIIASHFKDIFPFIQSCKFGNKCTHMHEPECAVMEAVENGDIASFRYENYLNIMYSLED